MPYLDNLNLVPINNHQIETNNHENENISDTNKSEMEKKSNG